MQLLVTDGSVVTPEGVREVDILCEDGRIKALVPRGSVASADNTLDASGRIVFPGFIDPHVHSRDPGQTEKEDFAHSTLGALLGGTTTVIEMPNSIPPVDSVEMLRRRKALLQPVASVDFALWGMSIGESNLAELAPLVAEGVAAIKIFWGYALRRDTHQLVYNIDDMTPERLLLPPNNGVVLQIFRAVAEAGGLLAAHCEDRDILAVSEAALGHPLEDYEDLLAARPDTAEATAIAVAAEFSRASGCRFHVVHTASAAGIDTVRSAQRRGVRITAETCPQYLTLTDADYQRAGSVMKVYPPIRKAEDQAALWEAVRDGTVASIGSDHAPHTLAEKALGLAEAPAGAVGCETFGPVMVDAFIRGKVSVERFAEVMSTSTAKLYGLHPRKGSIQPGSDADLTIVDPTGSRTILNEELVAKQPVSPWHGVSLKGQIADVVLRGRHAMHDGMAIGTPGGEFVAARHGQAV